MAASSDPGRAGPGRPGTDGDEAPRAHDPAQTPAQTPAPSDDTLYDVSGEDAEESRAGTGARAREAWAGLTPGRRRYVAVGVLLSIIGTALVVWWALAATVNKPNWRDVSFEVPNDTIVQMRFEITKPPEMTAVCTLLAQETNHGVVGRTTVVIPPSVQRTTLHEARIRTTGLAVIGTVRTCVEQ